MLGRHEPNKFLLDLSSVARDPLVIDAEVCIDVRFAILSSPARAARRRESDRHPDLAEIPPVALERWRIWKIIPLEQEPGPKHIIEHESRVYGVHSRQYGTGAGSPKPKKFSSPSGTRAPVRGSRA